jgi:hypothetical protein
MSIKRSCYLNQTVSEVAVDAPVAGLVGIGQGGTFDWAIEAAVIQLVALRGETDFDVAQAFESHGEKLIPTRERAHTLVATIASYAAIEFVVRKKLHQLRKDSATFVQESSPSRLMAKE